MRWIVLGLLLAATTINYLDRLMLSVLSPVLRDYFHFNESMYGNITAVFQLAYAFGYLFLGRLLDRMGTRYGFAIAAAVWSAASALHATVTGAAQFGIWRGMLGFAEGANFPACSKATAEWFPPEERALATGVFNAGVNLASVIGPPAFVALAATLGWRWCFLAVSLTGFVWVAVWLTVYRAPETVAGTVKTPAISMKESLRHRETWGYALGKALVDPVWFFFLFWLPLYFRDVRHLDMKEIGWALPFIYFMSGVGAIAGGWLSGYLLRRGWTRARARFATLLIAGIVMPFAAGGALADSITQAVVLFSVAAAAHQAFSSVLFAMPGDVFPSSAVATVMGVGGFAGAISSVIFSAVLPGYLIPIFGYTPLLLTLSSGYLAAYFTMRKLFGEFKMVTLDTAV